MRRITVREPLIKSYPRRRGPSKLLDLPPSYLPPQARERHTRLRGNNKPILDQSFPRPPRQRLAQRGQILLVLMILVIGFGAAFYTFVGRTGSDIERDKITTAALAQAKEALIGWSAARTPSTSVLIPPGLNARPGELPCPDSDNSGTDAGSCIAGAIGRVPWRSMGIPEPKDSAGETLWYAIAGPFRNYNMSSAPITSDTLGNMTVYLGSSASTLTSQAVAVIFAPGASRGTQDRSCTVGVNCTATGQCTTSPASLTPKCNPTNYLEAAGGVNNAAPFGNPSPPSFIQAQPADTFNDRLLVITNADLMPLVEQRVAREMMSILERYRIARIAINGGGSGDYPSADIANGDSNDQYNRHRFPCGGSAIPTHWGTGGTPSLPNWLTNGCGSVTGWAGVIFYAVAGNRLVGNACSTCGSTTITCPGTATSSSTSKLTVTNASNRVANVCAAGGSPFTCNPTVLSTSTGNANLILITPGAATSNRASGWPSSSSLDPISGYFDDPENANNDDYNCYVVPTSTNNDRDRIYVVP